jgi:hypothetical protein
MIMDELIGQWKNLVDNGLISKLVDYELLIGWWMKSIDSIQISRWAMKLVDYE